VQDKLVPLHAGVFTEAGVTGAKFALSTLGKVTEEVRLPLVPSTETTKKIIRAAMAHAGLIPA
jgi:4-hydroxy-tetrahydrodipicolinate synthase